MRFSEVLGAARYDDGVLTGMVPQEWLQGRTAYGGMSSALCAERIRREHPDLPPLRSAQIAFVGPAAGEVQVTARVVRQGKSTTFVQATLETEKGTGTSAMFIHGAGRPSTVALSANPAPDVPHHSELGASAFTALHPAFLQQFEVAPAAGGMPFLGQAQADMVWWGRHRDEAARGTEAGLLCIADLLPPAIAPLMTAFAPVSSVNWQIDFFGDDLSTEDGWYLIQSRAQWGGEGWSAQDMNVWTSDGRPVAAGRQTIVIFS